MRDYNKLLESQIKKVKERIPEPNRKLILDFIEEDKAKGISEGRMTSEVSQLLRIYSLLGKDFKKSTKKDLISVVNKLKEGRDYSENYINQQKITLVKFYEKIGMEKLVKDKKGKTIDFLKANRGKGISVSSKDILTEEEIQKAIRMCKNLRNRCFISLLYETGSRVGELQVIKRRDIRIENDQAILTLKTEKRKDEDEREVVVVYAVPDMIAYLDSMKDKDPDSFLWVKDNGELLSEKGFRYIVKEAFEKAGITKRVWLHLLRHSRVSHVSPHLTDSIKRQMFGWAKNSAMPSHYEHLTNGQVHETILDKLYGIENNGNGEKDLFCSRCKAKVREGVDNCWRCGLILNEKAKLEKDKEREEIKELKNTVKEFLNWVQAQPEGKRFFGEMAGKFKG